MTDDELKLALLDIILNLARTPGACRGDVQTASAFSEIATMPRTRSGGIGSAAMMHATLDEPDLTGFYLVMIRDLAFAPTHRNCGSYFALSGTTLGAGVRITKPSAAVAALGGRNAAVQTTEPPAVNAKAHSAFPDGPYKEADGANAASVPNRRRAMRHCATTAKNLVSRRSFTQVAMAFVKSSRVGIITIISYRETAVANPIRSWGPGSSA